MQSLYGHKTSNDHISSGFDISLLNGQSGNTGNSGLSTPGRCGTVENVVWMGCGGRHRRPWERFVKVGWMVLDLVEHLWVVAVGLTEVVADGCA